MFRRLTGKLDFIENDAAIIDVNGVGYEVFCSGQTLNQLPKAGAEIMLEIETHVREDRIQLFGFLSKEERQAYLLLNKVSGVGAKMALAILSIMTPDQLTAVIASQDKDAFKPVSGVGPKLAGRILVDLKDKFSFDGGEQISSGVAISSANTNLADNNVNDAVAALVNLGYSRSDAFVVINKIAKQSDSELTVSDLIKLGLKNLAA